MRSRKVQIKVIYPTMGEVAKEVELPAHNYIDSTYFIFLVIQQLKLFDHGTNWIVKTNSGNEPMHGMDVDTSEELTIQLA